jgi:hypothetical protein
METKHHAIVIGSFLRGSLEESISAALQQLGHRVEKFNYESERRDYLSFRALSYVADALNVSTPWDLKTGRRLTVRAAESNISLIIVVGAVRLSAGALAQMRSNNANVKILLYWPDPLLRLTSEILESINLYDGVYTFSRNQVETLVRLGANNVCWLPLAFDPTLHVLPNSEKQHNQAGPLTFIGSHRPEREQLVIGLWERGISTKIYGNRGWIKNAKQPKVLGRLWSGGEVFDRDYAVIAQNSLAVLNLTDATTPGAANMRYFESMGVGALLLTNKPCEMEEAFPEGQCCLYYQDVDDLAEKISYLRSGSHDSGRMRRLARRKILDSHTYVNRMQEMLKRADV